MTPIPAADGDDDGSIATEEQASQSSSSNSRGLNANSFIISLRMPSQHPSKAQTGIPSCGGGIVEQLEDVAYITKLRPTTSQDPMKSEDCIMNPDTYNLQDNVGVKEWSKLLKERVSDNGQVLILITGFNNHAPKAITRYRAVQNGLRKASKNQSSPSATATTVICFDWPAQKNVRYWQDRITARKASKLLFTTCIDILHKKVGLTWQRIHIMTFSMGSFLLYKALSHESTSSPKIGHVLMAQSDAARRNFTKDNPKFVPNFVSWIGYDFTCYWSSKDVPLQMSSMVRFRHRLGYQGLPKETLLWFGNHQEDEQTPTDAEDAAVSSNQRTKIRIHNVSCTQYYKSEYISSNKLQHRPAIGDSHEWVFFGGGRNTNVEDTSPNINHRILSSHDRNDDGDDGILLCGDDIFMFDVLQLLNGITTNFQLRQRKDSNCCASKINDWRLKTS